MARSSFASVVVIDRQGRVVAAAGEQPTTSPTEGPGIERFALPDGGFLVTRVALPDSAWSRFSRAFIHEARSPLNALAIYLELLGTRMTGSLPHGRPEAAPDRILAKANDQIRRIEELLRAFGELWGARGETTDLAEAARAACRFSEHEALRDGLQISHEICATAPVAVEPARFADALVLLLGGALRAPPDSVVRLKVAPRDERQVELAVEFASTATRPPLALLEPGEAALKAIGGRVTMGQRGLTAAFALAKV